LRAEVADCRDGQDFGEPKGLKAEGQTRQGSLGSVAVGPG
jgi:hypothetical protein